MAAACALALPLAWAEEKSAEALSPEGHRIVAGELLVRYRSDVVRSLSETGAGELAGLRTVKRYRATHGLQLTRLGEESDLEAAMEALKRSGLVERVSYNYMRSAHLQPNDPLFGNGSQWSLVNEGQLGGVADADVDADEAWDLVADTGELIIAVIDTGIRYTHEDLAENMWTNPNEIPGNGVDDDENGYVDDVYGINAVNGTGDPMDDHGHGTHIAGLLGAVGDNGKGIVGVLPRARIMALKFLDENGDGSDADAIECIDYAIEQGASIINLSWGGGGYNFLVEDRIREAGERGIFFVASAGNEGADNDQTPNYPASYELANVVSVTATDRFDRLAGFANFGEGGVDLAAPGVAMYSTYFGSDSDYRLLSGTSMAAPLASGALALLRTRFPDESIATLLGRLYAGSEVKESLARRCRTGARLNVSRALQDMPPPPLNDRFADAVPISIPVGSFASFNTTASVEPGEPAFDAAASGKTVWWRWRASESAFVRVATAGTDFEHALVVFQGSDPASLHLVDKKLDTEGSGTGAVLGFEAEAGQDYYLGIDGLSGAAGNISLSVSQSVSNDDWANAEDIEGVNERVIGSNFGASAEEGEPAHGESEPTRSVWWRWVAPRSGLVTLSTSGSNSVDTVMAVYRGSSLDTLSLVKDDDDGGPGLSSELSFFAVEGQDYYIAVDGWQGGSGEIALTVATGENDDFEEARPLVGDQLMDRAFAGGASKESGEPKHGGNDGGRSLWWEWISTRTGQATVNTFGSDFDTLLGVYRGENLLELAALSQNDDYQGSKASQALFQAEAGQAYRIAVDGFRGAFGQDFGLVQLQVSVSEDATSPRPAIRNLGKVRAQVGVAFALQIEASGSPTSFSAEALPEGLSIGAATGQVSGIPQLAGTFFPLLQASNASGSGVLAVAMTVEPAPGSPDVAPFIEERSGVLGESLTLSVEASGGELSYQWSKNGVALAGETSPSLTLPSLASGDEGDYYVRVENENGAVLAGPMRVFVLNELIRNISTRGEVGVDDDLMIVGFVVRGPGTRRLLARASGKSLENQGVSGTLEDPWLEIVKDEKLLFAGDNWMDESNAGEIEAVAESLGAFPLTSEKDAALLVDLPPGVYSMFVRGVGNTTGVALAEVYDAGEQTDLQPRLINISTRVLTHKGDQTAIAGFVLRGDRPKQVLIRAVGPGLAERGVDNYIVDPYLELYYKSDLIDVNDDWGFRGEAELTQVFESVGAFRLEAGSFDAAVLKTLRPGRYTAMVTDREFRPGTCLIEVYEVN